MRFIIVLISYFLLAISPASASHDRDKEATYKLKVAFNNPGFADHGFWKDVSDTMKAAADRFNIELYIWYGNRDPMTIRDNAAKIFDSPLVFDYIVMVNEYQQVSGFLRKAEQHKIPTLFLLNSLNVDQIARVGRPGDTFKYWLGSLVPDNHQAGYEMAQSLLSFAHEKGWKPPYRLLTLSGDHKTPASLYRNAGLGTLLEESRELAEVARFHTNWSKDRAFEATRSLLQGNQRTPQLVWAANDNLGLGAIEALEQRGLSAGKDYGVAGLNWSAEGLKAVRTRQFTMTHGGHFFAGAWAMVALYDHHNGQRLDSEIRFPMQPITLQNIDEFEAKLGARDWSKIDFSHFSKSRNKDLKTYDFTLKNLLAATHP